jgi:hypothetical protein
MVKLESELRSSDLSKTVLLLTVEGGKKFFKYAYKTVSDSSQIAIQRFLTVLT